MDDVKVRDVMTHLVVILRESDTVGYAASRLMADRISGAPVISEGRVVGLVSESDLVRAYAPRRAKRSHLVPSHAMMFLLGPSGTPGRLDTPVGEIMTTDVITIEPHASVWEAADKLQRYGVRRLPVVDEDGALLGIVARSDLVRALAGLGRPRPRVVAGVEG